MGALGECRRPIRPAGVWPWVALSLVTAVCRPVRGAATLWNDPAFVDYREAIRAYNDGDHQRALDLLKRSLARCPDNVLCLELAGDVCVLLKMPADAVGHYQRLRTLFPSYREAAFKLADAHDLAGQPEAARKVYLALLQHAPTDQRLLKQLLVLELRHNRDRSALRHAVRFLDTLEWRNERVEEVLVMFETTGKLDRIVSVLEQRVKTTATPAAMRAVAMHHFNARRYAQALTWWERLARRSDADAETLTCVGTCYYRLGKSDKAIEWYRKAIRTDPKFLDAWYNLGVAYLAKGQAKQAIQALRGVILIAPDSADVYEQIGQVYENQLLQMEMAKAYYEKARQVREQQKRSQTTQPSGGPRRKR